MRATAGSAQAENDFTLTVIIVSRQRCNFISEQDTLLLKGL